MTICRRHSGSAGCTARSPGAWGSFTAAAARIELDAVFRKHRLTEGNSHGAHASLDLDRLEVHQHSIPQCLHHAEGKTGPAVEQSESDDVTIEEIRDRAKRRRNSLVH